MAFFDSRVSKFLVDDTGGTQRDLSAHITEVRGLPGPRTLNEVTALGDSGAKFIPGVEKASITLHGMYGNTATSGPDAVLGPLRTHTGCGRLRVRAQGLWHG